MKWPVIKNGPREIEIAANGRNSRLRSQNLNKVFKVSFGRTLSIPMWAFCGCRTSVHTAAFFILGSKPTSGASQHTRITKLRFYFIDGP